MNVSSTEPFCCAKCGSTYAIKDRIGRRETCPKCDADLHTCLNCRHHNPQAHNEYNEPQAEWVREKERANFCDYFEPRRGGNRGNAGKNRQDDARTRFENLFKK